MPLVVYQYPACSTCKKALKWLDAQGIAYQSINIVLQPPSPKQLDQAASQLPLRALFNTSGESYRAGNFKERLPKLSQAEALAALAKDGKLIKRPFIVHGKQSDKVLVGFDEAAWAKALG
jgi:arsenate reductase